MKKNLLESEIKRFQELSNYDANNNSVLSENKLDFYDNENERILEMHHKATELEFMNEQVKRVKFNPTASVRTGNKHPRSWGKHGGSAGAYLNLDYKTYKEIDVELKSGADLLAKMNENLAGKADWKKIPPDVKSMLANGFNDFIQTAAESEFIKKLSRQKRRDLRKFFKKSQRWRFDIVNLNNREEKGEGEKLGSKLKSELTVTFPQGEGAPTEEQIQAEIRASLYEINVANSESGAIASTSCNGLVAENMTVTDEDGVTYTVTQAANVKVQKLPLETAVVYEMVTPQTYKRVPGSYVMLQDDKEIVIPNEPSGFKAGSDAVNATYVDSTVQKIYEQLMNTTFELKDNKTGKVMMTKTGRDIVEDSYEGLTSSTIILDYMDVISSASNVWSGKKLDFTHSNDGTKVKELNQLPTSGNDKSNTKLAMDRNRNLTASVLAALEKLPGIKKSRDFELGQEVRITDTAGFPDGDKNKPSTHPNPGQYAGFKIGFWATAEEKEVKAEKKGVKGKIGQSLIKLVWLGKKDKDVTWNFDIGFEFHPGVKNKILKKNIFTGQLEPGGSMWSKRRGYNKSF